MLALARVMMTKPRLLMIDELALGLAPMTVDRLMDIVRGSTPGDHRDPGRAERQPGHDLAEHAFFLERGRSASTGPRDLLDRDDLLRPVFLASGRRTDVG